MVNAQDACSRMLAELAAGWVSPNRASLGPLALFMYSEFMELRGSLRAASRISFAVFNALIYFYNCELFFDISEAVRF
jgi:hypothetical protein